MVYLSSRGMFVFTVLDLVSSILVKRLAGKEDVSGVTYFLSNGIKTHLLIYVQ